MHLVTITSDGEQTFVEAFGATTERWIGLQRTTGVATKANYKWITGETSTYDHWVTGEPNGSGNCGRLLGDGQWADYYCDTTFSYICERE